ncbi:hypothetical protein TWF694_001908 [Orbilia ellipsospora]|uniref:Uncharacterized protein n=1 Tax=Orbilia ellipsospora TaxID=2528407 RepID=A0AAV9XA45_9PEZI
MEHKMGGSSTQPGHSTVEKRIKQYLALFDSLLSDLKSGSDLLRDPRRWAEGRVGELEGMVERCARGREGLGIKEDHGGLDGRGTELWNMTTKLLRGEEVEGEVRKVHLRREFLAFDESSELCVRIVDFANKLTPVIVRHLAYLTLDCAQRTCGRTVQGLL